MLFDKRRYFKIILKQKQCIEIYYLHQTKQTRGPVRTIKNKHNLRYANSTTTITEGCNYILNGFNAFCLVRENSLIFYSALYCKRKQLKVKDKMTQTVNSYHLGAHLFFPSLGVAVGYKTSLKMAWDKITLMK